jgi:uracil-DNA glycosylase
MKKAEQLREVYEELEKQKSRLPLGTIGEPIVPGDGDPESELLFIGEAPGYYESVQGKPFVGRSGQLLNQTLADIGFPREKIYITNIVKIRPPENRDPTPVEIAAFRPVLNKEIEIIQPKIIITLGRYSMGKFLPDVKISQVHGRLHRVKWDNKPIYVLPMYHPSAALRSTQTKTAFVTDLQKIPKVLEWLKQQGDVEKLESDVKEALF